MLNHLQLLLFRQVLNVQVEKFHPCNADIFFFLSETLDKDSFEIFPRLDEWRIAQVNGGQHAIVRKGFIFFGLFVLRTLIFQERLFPFLTDRLIAVIHRYFVAFMEILCMSIYRNVKFKEIVISLDISQNFLAFFHRLFNRNIYWF